MNDREAYQRLADAIVDDFMKRHPTLLEEYLKQAIASEEPPRLRMWWDEETKSVKGEVLKNG